MATDNNNKILNVPNKREQSETCFDSAERGVLRPKGNVPNLRFAEFSGEWEQCTIGSYGNIITGSTPSTSDTGNYDNGTYLWASPTDLGELKYIEQTQTKLTDKGFSKTRRFPANSIMVTCIGSTIGKMGMSKVEMSTNQQINTIVPTGHDANFVFYTIQSRFPRYLSSIAVQAVPIISKSAFEKLENYTTSIDEEVKIGTFLSLLDERITTQNKIIQQLQSLIKGIVVSVTEETPNTRIDKCLVCHSSTLQENQIEEFGYFPVYGANGICGYTDKADFEEPAILIVKDGSGVGNVRYVSGQYSAIGTQNILTSQNGYCIKYIYFCLQAFNFVPYKTGMAIPHIYFKDYGKAKSIVLNMKNKLRLQSKLKISKRK